VDDHAEPIRELRRLLGLHTRMRLVLETTGLYERREWGAAIAATQASLERFPGDPLLLYNLACYESLDGRRDAALAHLAQALSADPTMREMARADSDLGSLAGEPQFRALVEA
jgi:Flp pilus assembly protein TadD